MRCFVAINLSSEIIQKIDRFVLGLKAKYKQEKISWVKPENYHITLDFLGDIDEGRVADVCQSVEKVVNEYKKFDINIEIFKFTAFPSEKRPRVLVLESNPDENGCVYDIQKKIHCSLLKKGFKLDDKKWRIHITIGRIKNKVNINFLNFSFCPVVLKISEISVMESVLERQGARYTKLQSFCF